MISSQGSSHEGHEEPIVAQPGQEALARGHEPDGYDPASVWSVPILVIVFFVLAFVTTTILFYYLAPSPERPDVHPLAAERNKAPLDERLARITRGGEVDQPRLEPLRIRTGDARAITRPEAPVGNSPEIHPEDLRPTPTTTPDLYRTGWLDPNKTAARVTIEQAMHLALEKNVFAVRKEAVTVPSSVQLPTAANAGRGAASSGSTAAGNNRSAGGASAHTPPAAPPSSATKSSAEKPGPESPNLPQAPQPRPTDLEKR